MHVRRMHSFTQRRGSVRHLYAGKSNLIRMAKQHMAAYMLYHTIISISNHVLCLLPLPNSI